MPSFQTLKGRQYFAPAVIVDVKNELVAPPPLGKSIAIFGDFPHLEAGKVYTFTQGGASTIEELYPNVPKLRRYNQFWRNPISGGDGQADAISFINCGSNTQASADHPNDDSSVTDAAEFKSRFWGTAGNTFAYRLETPDSTTTDPAGIRLEAGESYYRIRAWAPGLGSDISYEFGLPAQFKLSVEDAVGSGTADVDLTAGILTIDPSDGSAATFTLADFDGTDSLVDAINNTVWGGDVVISAEAQAYDVHPSNYDEFDETIIDGASLELYAHGKALEDGLAAIPDAPISVTFKDGRYRLLGANGGDAFAVSPLRTTLSGGTQSAASASSYSSVFLGAEALGKDFTTCAVESTTASVHKSFQRYLSESALGQKERNGYVPAPANQTISAIYGQYVLPLNDARISVVGQEISYTDYKGSRIDGSTADCAVFMACLQGALAIAQPLTAVVANILDTSEAWTRTFDSDKLVRKGILAIDDRLAIIRSVTSYMKDNESYNCEVSVRESADASARDLRSFLVSELGTKITSSSKGRIKQLTEERLRLHREQAIIFGFKNVKVNIVGDTAYVEYDVKLTESLNFIRVTANLVSEL